MLTEAQLFDFESNLKRGSRAHDHHGRPTTARSRRHSCRCQPDACCSRDITDARAANTATAAAETFKAEQQLDDVRRSALVARLSGILTDEERDNFSAALIRRPLVKRTGMNLHLEGHLQLEGIVRDARGQAGSIQETTALIQSLIAARAAGVPQIACEGESDHCGKGVVRLKGVNVMRYGCAALLMLLSSAVTASAQTGSRSDRF